MRFRRGETGEVVAAMRHLAARADGQGWINIGPELPDEDHARVPERPGLAAWFSGRGPAVAMGTWIPASAKGHPAQIGVEHGTGPKALHRLAERGLTVPPAWRKRQDHGKHGIVIDLPADADPGSVVHWLVVACTDLMSVVEAGDQWQAVVHAPAAR